MKRHSKKYFFLLGIRLILICPVMCFLGAVSIGSNEFQPWSEKVFQYVRKEYGENSEKRLRYLHDVLKKNQGLSVKEKLKLANDTMNHLPWIADEKHWKNADYWATPLETLITFGGDCEDIAIAKWLMLRNLGIPDKHLRLACTKIKLTGERHMVLLYLENPDVPLEEVKAIVLDNYISEVMRVPKRKDLLWMYLFDTSGNVVLLSDDGKTRSIKGIYNKRKIKKLEELKKKIAETLSKYQELNDGRPLWSLDF